VVNFTIHTQYEHTRSLLCTVYIVQYSVSGTLPCTPYYVGIFHTQLSNFLHLRYPLAACELFYGRCQRWAQSPRRDLAKGVHQAIEEVKYIGEHQYVKELDQDRKMCGFIQNVRRGQKWSLK
jgi:hypothetical protein